MKDSSMDSEAEEKLIFFYHPDHLGSTSYVTDADGNIAQHVEYIPYGEVFVEERNSQFSTNYLFNAKELDNETGLYYYGARYLDPTGAMWLSVDPLFEKYAGMSPYNYCAGNPVKMVDPDGRELKDIFKGAIAAINDNIMLGVGDYRGRMGRQAVDASDYNLGLIIGDGLSMLIGSGEMMSGIGMMAQGSAVVAVSVSGGVTAPVAVAGAGEVVAGAALAEHGYFMAAQGASNLANKKGHLPESSSTVSGSKSSSSESIPSKTLWKNEKFHMDVEKPKGRQGQIHIQDHKKINGYIEKATFFLRILKLENMMCQLREKLRNYWITHKYKKHLKRDLNTYMNDYGWI